MTARIATRIATALRSIARPLLVATAAIMAAGAALASLGIAAGWFVYLVGFAMMALAVPTIGVLHAGRIGRLGVGAFTVATIAILLAIPVVAMVAGFVSAMGSLHDLLMPYALTPAGMAGLFGTILGVFAVGVTVARAGAFSPISGWLIAAAAIIDVPVELGLLPLPVWGLAVVLLAVGLVTIARAVPAAEPTPRPQMVAA